MSQGDTLDTKQGGPKRSAGAMSTDTEAPPLGYRPNEPTPGKDSLEHPQGRDAWQQTMCPDCGLPFGEQDFHGHGDPVDA